MAYQLPEVHTDPETGEYYTDNFEPHELRCRCEHCKGVVGHQMTPHALQRHQKVRIIIDRPIYPNSAYRCSLHPMEAKKDTPGEHNRTAMDYPYRTSNELHKLIYAAIATGATGIGIHPGFVHIDYRPGKGKAWLYKFK